MNPIFVKLCKITPEEKNLGNTHVYDLCLNISPEEFIFLMVKTAHAFVEKDHKSARFHANTFHGQAKILFKQFHVVFLSEIENYRLLRFLFSQRFNKEK